MRGTKRPRDANKLAKLIVDIAIGEAEDKISTEKKRASKNKRGRPGGLKGGKARASALTSQRRSEIARKAAFFRWKNLS